MEVDIYDNLIENEYSVFMGIDIGLTSTYLILQLDECGSSVGYETRIEADLRSFQNHFLKDHVKVKLKNNKTGNSLITDVNQLKGKVLLMPSMGDYPSKLLEANLRRQGIKTCTLFNTEDSIKKSLISNSGQCLPLNIILQNAFDYIGEHNLEPSNTVIWMMQSTVSCNLGMFINYMSKMLGVHGNEYKKIGIYQGKMSFDDFSVNTSINAYLAFLFGEYLRKLECKLRPYEVHKGQTDAMEKRTLDLFYDTFVNGTSKEQALKKAIGV